MEYKEMRRTGWCFWDGRTTSLADNPYIFFLAYLERYQLLKHGHDGHGCPKAGCCDQHERYQRHCASQGRWG